MGVYRIDHAAIRVHDLDGTHAATELLGHFRLLVIGERVGLPPASQRLLAYVILAGSVISRARVAGLYAGSPRCAQ